jgi:hypothetical protein
MSDLVRGIVKDIVDRCIAENTFPEGSDNAIKRLKELIKQYIEQQKQYQNEPEDNNILRNLVPLIERYIDAHRKELVERINANRSTSPIRP